MSHVVAGHHHCVALKSGNDVVLLVAIMAINGERKKLIKRTFSCFQSVAHNGKMRSKRGLLPFVEVNGEEIADSEFIIQNLSKAFGKDLDEGMTKEQLGIQHGMSALVDNHLQW